MRIYVLIPCYNESSNIEKLSKNITKFFDKKSTKLVFVNDGSKDNTVEKLNKYFSFFDLKIIDNKINKGPGFCFNMGFEWILKDAKESTDVIITMEADNTSDISLVPSMISLNKIGFDIVLASIYCQGGSFVKTSILRKLLSLGANILLRLLFDLKVQTLSSFYRLYTVNSIKQIKEKHTKIVEENGFISMIEILIKLVNEDFKIIEIPMKLDSSNRKGKSKMKIIKTTFSYIKFIFFSKLK